MNNHVDEKKLCVSFDESRLPYVTKEAEIEYRSFSSEEVDCTFCSSDFQYPETGGT